AHSKQNALSELFQNFFVYFLPFHSAIKMSEIKIEFAVQMGGEKCADKVREALKGMGELEIDSKQGRVIIHTQEPWFVIKEK
ncbi:hypothetical protein DOY81_013852, partial [Sarcophaga bullata]